MMLLVDFSGPMRDRLQAQAALGGAVSLVVGLLFWPRGAAAALGSALADAYRSSLAYLSEVTSLVTGVSGVRLAADAVLAVWQADDRDPDDRASRPFGAADPDAGGERLV
ncbi:MAG: hypothetical protein M3Y09_08605 [Actinomycetota bacterium]|nr:hypothetical protein [Actinomycetota bacterium]